MPVRVGPAWRRAPARVGGGVGRLGHLQPHGAAAPRAAARAAAPRATAPPRTAREAQM